MPEKISKTTFAEALLERVRDILYQKGRDLSSLKIDLLPQVEVVAKNIANQIEDLLERIGSGDQPAEENEETMSREVAVDELSDIHKGQICIAASKLSGTKFTTDQCHEAIATLRKLGFEIRRFNRTTYTSSDIRLKELPEKWFFDQIDSGMMSSESATTEDLIVICEVREKPDVVDEKMWIQKPYPNDPFSEELKALHEELARNRLVDGKILPEARAGFTYTQLESVVLPRFSAKIGLKVICMPQIYASVLANTHPEIGRGRSTEWRSDNIGENHVVISGRSERGPVRFVYYDWKEDPYPNRGFRLCIVLQPKST